MTTHVGAPVVWCMDDAIVTARKSEVAAEEYSITLSDGQGYSVANLMLSKTAAERLYAALWSTLVDAEDCIREHCDLDQVAQMGGADDEGQCGAG